jgi:hypothetical protein
MGNVVNILKEEILDYGRSGHKLRLFPLLDDQRGHYAVNAISYPERKHPMRVIVMARLEGDCIIIEEDRSDKPLYEALMARDIPRQRIILAYAGEAPPEATVALNTL